MDKNCLVSAIITTHKREPIIIERAIKSILNQTYKNLEIIVVDDSPNSYDLRESVKLLVESYADYGVKYIQHDTCKGACAARNTGLLHAKGEYIGYLDDDDEWLPEKIEEQLKAFDSDNVALVYCGKKIIYESTGQIVEAETVFERENVVEMLMYKNFIGSTSFPLLKTEALREIGGFDLEMQSAQDYDVWLRISKKYAINYVEKKLVLYHFHEGEQITSNPEKKVAGLERIITKNKEYLSTHRKAYWVNYMALARWYAKLGKKKKAFLIWIKTVFKAPLEVKKNVTYLYSIFKCKK